jgi:hypothetical protein
MEDEDESIKTNTMSDKKKKSTTIYKNFERCFSIWTNVFPYCMTLHEAYLLLSKLSKKSRRMLIKNMNAFIFAMRNYKRILKCNHLFDKRKHESIMSPINQIPLMLFKLDYEIKYNE